MAGSTRRATHYVVKAEIGGLAGLLAPLVGKQPPDTHVWILEGPAPAFVKSEGPLFYGGPLWRIELTSPVWPAARRDIVNSEAHMNVLLLSMPDSFEHMPPIVVRMPNGALSSIAGNIDPHHRVAIADLILVQSQVVPAVQAA